MIPTLAAGGAIIAVGKWAGPSALLGAAVLAVTDATVITGVITAVQVMGVAALAYLQHRREMKAQNARARQDQQLEATRLQQATTTGRIDGQDRLIDQLQEQSEKDRMALQLARDVIAAMDSDHREASAMMEADYRKLQQQVTTLEIGVMRLTAQIEDLGGTPVWPRSA